MQEIPFDSWVGKMCWRRDRLPTPVFLGFPGGSDGKESACNVGELGSIPGLGRSTGEGKGYPFQYSGLENSMDCIVHGIAKSQTRPSNFHRLYQITKSLNAFFLQPSISTLLFFFLLSMQLFSTSSLPKTLIHGARHSPCSP